MSRPPACRAHPPTRPRAHETKNLFLEETAALFDGDEAIERLEHVAGVAHLGKDSEGGVQKFREEVKEQASGLL